MLCPDYIDFVILYDLYESYTRMLDDLNHHGPLFVCKFTTFADTVVPACIHIYHQRASMVFLRRVRY